MSEKHNSNIKFDLHIHSNASAYKETGGIVDNSTIENINVLLSKLNEYQIALFSITDHNRFNLELYKALYEVLKKSNHKYPYIKTLIPGIEFDVDMEDNLKTCHIIAIFDAVNDISRLEKINNVINENKLEKLDGFYKKNNFEKILQSIGISAILIASQHKDISNHSGKHRSLSDSVKDVGNIIRIGYIDALEFQKPQVEGILINNLKSLASNVTLLSGSDCHSWDNYPYHSAGNKNLEFHHSKAKILPTFKGLLMAITSPETRFNGKDNYNYHIQGFKFHNEEINFVNGINAIVGENGSGKTTLLDFIYGENINKDYIKDLVKRNELAIIAAIDPIKVNYIYQGQIIDKFRDNTLFSSNEENNFIDINNERFVEIYTSYANQLYEFINSNILKAQSVNSLSQYSIQYEKYSEDTGYFINIECSVNFTDIDNPHDKAYKDINNAVDAINKLIENVYFHLYDNQIKIIINELHNIQSDVNSKWKKIKKEIDSKNIIYECIQEYNIKCKNQSTAKDKEIIAFKEKRQKIIDSIVEALRNNIIKKKWPDNPKLLEGFTSNPKRGFNFNKKAAYDSVSMINNFYLKMFNKTHESIDRIKSINTHEDFAKAIRDCTATGKIQIKWKENLEKFINEAIKEKEYITDSSNKNIGNTLGEMSLCYYKYYTEENSEWEVLIIDQPEDNISNNNINQKLISYFNSLRNEKQLIFVTHNPLLVVNLDVDNVIFIKNEDKNISITDGCLEYVDENANILDLIAKNMDGGKETIEKRLKVYGKTY